MKIKMDRCSKGISYVNSRHDRIKDNRIGCDNDKSARISDNKLGYLSFDKIRLSRPRLFMLIIFSIMFLVVLSSSVLSLGITPGRTTFDYEPGVQKTVEFTVVNTENVDMNLVVLVQGTLNESVSVSEVSFQMGADEKERKLSYTLSIPSNLPPGLNEVEVVVIQLPGKSSTSEAFIGAAIGVATQIHVFVPFPGKFAEANLNVIGPEANGEITFVMPVVSRGELDLVRVRGTVDVYTSLNEKIDTLSTNEIKILSGERGEIVARWDASSVAPGPYRAIATVIYDEETLSIEKEFSVGVRRLELQNVEVNDFSLGGIAKFEFLVESKWSESIKGVFSQMLIYNDDGEVMADFKSPTEDIDSLTKVLMVAFWDTAGVRKGTYDASLLLRYGSSSEQQDFKLEVKDNEINVIGVGYVISNDSSSRGLGGSTLTVVLITVIVVLILINLLWFLVLRKKLKGRKK